MRIYILLAMALTTTLSRAVTNMCVETKSGSIYRYDVEHVTEVDYKENVPIDTAVNEAGVPSEEGLSMNGKIGNYSYVDLGLPSRLKWATYNVGASKPTECGDYFAWGETSPKKVFKENNYKLSKDSSKTFTKYFAYEDTLINLEECDDAATANCGRGWRMPTDKELTELRNSCTWTWTNNFNGSGVAGRIGTSKTNGNTIFFPAAGYRVIGGLFAVNVKGEYWSSSRKSATTNAIRTFRFTSSYGGDNLYARFWGLPIRAVGSDTSRNDYYNVRFYDRDSTLIESQTVKWGEKVHSPTAPEINGFEFTGWSDSSFTFVTKNMCIYAQYNKQGVAESGKVGNYPYVDLGLPSGTKWATYNVGASKPTEYGDYFAWGETEPKEDYSWETYKWFNTYKWNNGYVYTQTKYCADSLYGTVDNLTTLLAEDDAATVNWGNNWRMPTTTEQQELIDGCNWEWTDNFNGSGVAGRIGTSMTNGNIIFLPAAGYRLRTDTDAIGYYGYSGYYWSSSLADSSSNAYYLYISSSYIARSSYLRYYGRSVRAVVK